MDLVKFATTQGIRPEELVHLKEVIAATVSADANESERNMHAALVIRLFKLGIVGEQSIRAAMRGDML